MIYNNLLIEFCGYLAFHFISTLDIYLLGGPIGAPRRRKKSYKDSHLTLAQFMMTSIVFVIYKDLFTKSLIFMTFKPFWAYAISLPLAMVCRERIELIYQLIIDSKSRK